MTLVNHLGSVVTQYQYSTHSKTSQVTKLMFLFGNSPCVCSGFLPQSKDMQVR